MVVCSISEERSSVSLNMTCRPKALICILGYVFNLIGLSHLFFFFFFFFCFLFFFFVYLPGSSVCDVSPTH